MPAPALDGLVPELRHHLLAWWQHNGRHTIPWKLHPDGRRVADGESLDPYPIWIAEANRG